MGARAQDSGGLAVRPPFRPSVATLDGPVDARWVAELGRAVTIWVPVFVVTAGRIDSPAAALFTASLLATVWLFALRSAFRAVPFTLGPAVPASVGTITGLVVVSAVTLWVPLPHSSLPISRRSC